MGDREKGLEVKSGDYVRFCKTERQNLGFLVLFYVLLINKDYGIIIIFAWNIFLYYTVEMSFNRLTLQEYKLWQFIFSEFLK